MTENIGYTITDIISEEANLIRSYYYDDSWDGPYYVNIMLRSIEEAMLLKLKLKVGT